MFKYFTRVVSKALGFTKTESKGTLVLILIIVSVLFFSQTRLKHLKNEPVSLPDSVDLAWIKTVQASYELKKSETRKTNFSVSKKETPTTYNDFEKRSEPKIVDEIPIIIGDLNLANMEDLQEVKGIGPAFSERIVKYRDLLGGFSDMAQLEEVYGLKQETISNLTKRYQIKSPVRQINLNTDSIKHLAIHPYISYDLARVIVNYRKEHGDFDRAEDLLEIKAIDNYTFTRLKSYLN